MTKENYSLLKLVEQLKKLMHEKDVSMQQLARDSGVSVATISRIINGLTIPKFGSMYDMFIELGVELEIKGYTIEGGFEKF